MQHRNILVDGLLSRLLLESCSKRLLHKSGFSQKPILIRDPLGVGYQDTKGRDPQADSGGGGSPKQKDSCLCNARIGSTLKMRDYSKAVSHLFNDEVQALA